MLMVFFLISFDYNVLRTLKDSLLITAKGSGAEVIPFVKVWGVLPGAILMTVWFAWLSNRFKQETVFYTVITFFLSYFFIFAFFLYPLRDSIHPNYLADQLESILPVGLKGFTIMFRYWSFTLFYVLSELWSSTVLSVLFWGFANQVTKICEAKRFYGLFGVAANFSGIIAGQVSVMCCYFTEMNLNLPFGEDSWHQALILMVSLILIAGVVAMLSFKSLNKHIGASENTQPSQLKAHKEVRGKLSLKQSISLLLKSKYLMSITVIVVAYNLAINLTEVLLKDRVKALYPSPTEYTLFMNHIVSIIGVVATLSSLFVASNAIRKFGWTFTALVTPVIILVTSIGFFGFYFLSNSYVDYVSLLGFSLSPLAAVVAFGVMQNVLSRGAKYSVFDATKEMSFVPLSSESKLIGKAAIDGVCSRLGKSGGSFVFQTLFIFFSTISASSPYVAVVLLVVLIVWIVAVKQLGTEFHKLTSGSKDGVNEPLNVIEEDEDILPVAAALKEQQAT